MKGSKHVVTVTPDQQLENSFPLLKRDDKQEKNPTHSYPTESNQPEPITADSRDMAIDEVGDSEEYHKLRFIEQKMDNAILSFIEMDHTEIDENIREQAQTLNLDWDWIDQLHISDVGQSLIQETKLNLEWQATLFLVLQQKFAHFVQEYETQHSTQDTKQIGITTQSHRQQKEQHCKEALQ